LRESLFRAAVLGLVQGPTEVLPVSSSAHIALLPGLLGWRDVEPDAESHNSLEVALHAGTAAALLITFRGELAQSLRRLDSRTPLSAVLALTPAALVGYLLEQQLECRPSGPRALAVGLGLGGAAMAWADLRSGTRTLADTGPCDYLVLGVAQALALLPGVSRNGAALTATRARKLTREDSHALSWRVGLPLIAGATALKLRRVLQHGATPGAVTVLATGALAAFASTLASAPLIRPHRRGQALWPFALYRCAVALLALRRPRH
jgi:undecaprenyl-diphosphatase